MLLTAAPAAAQTVTADRFQLKTGPCTLRSGSGSPEGAVAGQVCDTFWRTDTGQIYTKDLRHREHRLDAARRRLRHRHDELDCEVDEQLDDRQRLDHR